MQNKILFLFIGAVLILGCTQSGQITNFDECVNAGNPVMESYPRQCMANGETFVEEIEFCVRMSIDNAFAIAEESVCASEGALLSAYVCNEGTNTLWIDLDIDMEGCSPACVVNVLTGEAEINYRCTGLIIE
jgi:hypothetical protein